MFDAKRSIGITFLVVLAITTPVGAQQDKAKKPPPPAASSAERPRISLSGWCREIRQRYAIHLREDVNDGHFVDPKADGGAWPAFRGPSGNGISKARNVPIAWSRDKNVKWRAPLPAPGNSSPIVSGNRLFITCAQDEGRRRSLYCFDRATGKQLWVRTVEFDKVMLTHETNPYCASTPVVASNRIVVWHGSAGLYCYDLRGNELWSRDLGKFRHIWGYASSPVFYKDRIILNCGPGERSFMTAIKLTNGATLWTTDEPGGDSGQAADGGRGRLIGSWSTPVIVQVDGKDQIVCSMPARVNGYHSDTGDIIWTCDGLANLPRANVVYSSPVFGGGVGVAMGGYNGPAIGFQLGGSGNVTESHQLWRITKRNPQRIGSGIILGKHLFQANAGPGMIQCLNVETGGEVWRERMKGGNAWGSMVLAEGRLYVTNQSGNTVVFAANPEQYEGLSVNPLGEPSNSTPAVADGQIFLRTFKAVYCIEE